MSVTGPGDFSEDLDNIQAVGTPQRMGSDSFSDSTVIISGGSDGQVYECTASNGVSSDPTGSVELTGLHFAIYSHAVTHTFLTTCMLINTIHILNHRNNYSNIINLWLYN